VADDKRTKMGTGPVVAQVPQPTPPPSTEPPAQTSYLPPQPAQVDPLIGTTIVGRYSVVKKLGEGGMGAVYLATHQVLEKQVALKVLHAEFARKTDLVERFMQEAKAASRIRHENVIDISDFGTTPEGLVFFAMELLHGHDLHEEVARARLAGQLLPWSRSKRIFLQICAALQAAHGKGIIHRDLKPENVYLVEFLGDPDFVKLLDFGIAKLTEVAEGDRKLTRTGMLFGTPEYMSPEQARGEPHVDARVDVYAMGCILFQLVTGRVPFEAENFMGVLSLHLTEPPPMIAAETFDRIGAPRALANVITKALEKDRNARWQSIEELANAVRTVCGDPLPSATSAMAAQRAPSVPAPANTTQKAIAVPNPTPVPGARVRTQWTGNLNVPEVEDSDGARKPKSKLPLVIGGGVVIIAGAIVAFMAARGGDDKKPKDPITAPSGSAPISLATPDAAPAAVPVDAPTVDLPPLPDKVVLSVSSKPANAELFDLASQVRVGKTPISFNLSPSHASRQFALRLKGYNDVVFEVTPNKPKLEVTEKLVKGAAPIPGPGSTKIPEGSNTPPPPIDAGVAAPPVTPDAGKPVLVDPGCTDDDESTPCLKDDPSRKDQ
jgi:eukaryotic-like serine/threonine-protein kinase